MAASIKPKQSIENAIIMQIFKKYNHINAFKITDFKRKLISSRGQVVILLAEVLFINE